MASSQLVQNNNFLKYQSFGNAMIPLSKAIVMSWLLMWTLSPHLGACTILHWSLLHLPAKLRGGDACQNGLSSPPSSEQETHVQESKQVAKLVERSCLLSPYSTGLSLAPAKRAQRGRCLPGRDSYK